MMGTPRKLTKLLVKEILEPFDTVLFDCTGVLWHPTTGEIPGAVKTLKKLRTMGKQVIFVTNNSAKSRSQLQEKFTKFGIEVDKDEIFSSAYTAALFLKYKLKFSGKLYMMGSPGLEEEMKLQNIAYTGTGADLMDKKFFNHCADHVGLDPGVTGVVVGFDPHFSYMKVLKAASYLRNPDVTVFIGTNGDPQLPMHNSNIVMPGTGSLVRTVEVASKRKATVLGKPSRFTFECIQEKFEIDPKRTLMIGDTLKSDILFGKNCGLKTLAVLTGITSEEEIVRCQKSEKEEERELVPDFYVESIGHFGELLE